MARPRADGTVVAAPSQARVAEANDREAVERRDAPETTAMVDSDEEDKKSDNSSDSDSDDKDDPEPFEPDPDAVAAASWPDRRDCPKGPLPGGVDPEGILATVPLLDDILAALSKADTEDVGVAVEAVETLAAHEDARCLLIPSAPAVIPKLIRHIASTARQMEEARANGGVVKQPTEKEKKKEKKKEKAEEDGEEGVRGADFGSPTTTRRGPRRDQEEEVQEEEEEAETPDQRGEPLRSQRAAGPHPLLRREGG